MLTASLKRISDLEDHLDLMKDEFERIRALTDNPEILGLCDRASQSTTQNVSVIRQRDSAEAELTKLKADVVRLMKALENMVNFFGVFKDADFPEATHQGFCGPESGCDGNCQTIANMAQHNAVVLAAARALEETK